MFPIGYLLLTINKDYDPNSTLPGTWEKLTEGYVLKTITSGDGGTTTAVGNTGPSSGNTGASSGNTGNTTLTLTQVPSHSHILVNGSTQQSFASIAGGAGQYGSVLYNASSGNAKTNSQGGGGAHNHSLNNHTHSLNSHTHSAGMPANIGVYAWKRTA